MGLMLGWASDYRQKLRAAIGPHEPSDLRSEFGVIVGLTSWPSGFALAALCPLIGWWVLGPLAARERRPPIRGSGSPR